MSQPTKKKRIKLAKIKVEPQEVHVKVEPEEVFVKKEPQEAYVKTNSERCTICWNEPPVNAIRLECNHVFCFLCIKSVASATGRCALCRAEIDQDFEVGEFDLVGEAKFPAGSNDGYFWFYEGKRGWWLYDADTNKELEEAYQNGGKRIEKLIAGQVYVITLRNLSQYQKSDSSRSRKICRHTLDLDNILGLAGIRNDKLSEAIRRRRRAVGT